MVERKVKLHVKSDHIFSLIIANKHTPKLIRFSSNFFFDKNRDMHIIGIQTLKVDWRLL